MNVSKLMDLPPRKVFEFAKKIEVENKDGEKEETEKTNMFLKMSAFFHC